MIPESRTHLCRMLVITGVFSLCGMATESGADSIPDYLQLYEEGYYTEAVTILDSLVAQSTLCRTDLLFFLASCHIASGNTALGTQQFRELFACDSSYTLDTLLTSPKIVTVYRGVKAETDMKHSRRTTAAPSPVTSTTAVSDTARKAALHLPAIEPEHRLTVLRYPVGLLPAGIPQLTINKKISALFFFAAQAAAVTGTLWAYNKREHEYDPDFGWHSGNRQAYNKYTVYSRIGVSIFIGAYSASVFNYFFLINR